MARAVINQTIVLAAWRRFAPLAFIIPVMLDFLLCHGTSYLIFTNKEFGLLLPGAYAISPDQNVNYSSRKQRNLYGGASSGNNKCGSYCYSSEDEACDKNNELMKETNSKRRRAIEWIRSAKRSVGSKIIQSDRKISKTIGENPFRKCFFFKQQKQKCLRETTRLVGGANHVEAEDSTQQHDPSPVSSPSIHSPDASQRTKLFVGKILSRSKCFFVPEKSGVLRKNILETFALLRKISSQAGPSIITMCLLFRSTKKDEISLLTLYMLALLGASCGFHLFLHFITLGYALGVTLPLIVALLFYQKQYELPIPTVLHSSITICWGIRLFSFFAIREYYTWPALHRKVVEIQEKMNIPYASKILCWFLYSFFYVSLVASCWSRLLQSSSSCRWGVLGYTGLSLQLIGLSLETIADLQKNSFKSCNRLSWCNVGVWKYSTHPNYLGEGVFWWGTYLAHGFHSPFPSVLATVGLVFILYVLKGSAKSLSSKQKEKYGLEVDFYQFQRTHNVFGPKQIWSRQQAVKTVAPLQTEVMTDNFDNPVHISNDRNTKEISPEY